MTGNFTVYGKETTYEEIARELKNRIYKPVYYLMGEESYYIDRISEYIAQTVLNENEKNSIRLLFMGLIQISRLLSMQPSVIP